MQKNLTKVLFLSLSFGFLSNAYAMESHSEGGSGAGEAPADEDLENETFLKSLILKQGEEYIDQIEHNLYIFRTKIITELLINSITEKYPEKSEDVECKLINLAKILKLIKTKKDRLNWESMRFEDSSTGKLTDSNGYLADRLEEMFGLYLGENVKGEYLNKDSEGNDLNQVNSGFVQMIRETFEILKKDRAPSE